VSLEAGRPDKINGDSPGLPKVLRCLFEEHRHLAALMRALERKARQDGRLKVGDYYLMRDIVAYMHEYPDHVHHPTENRLFEKLLLREPFRKKALKCLRNDHEAVINETQNLLQLLDDAIGDMTEDREQAARLACEAFVTHQQEHMQFENQKLFPAAIGALSNTDWKQLEAHFAAAADPLFGRVVASRHRLLYEYLVDSADKVSEQFSVSRLFSLERLILTVDILEKGTGSWWTRLKNLGEAVSEETRSTVAKSLKPECLGSAIGLPVRYTAFLGKSLLDCGSDLLRIYADTTKDTLALYTGRKAGK